VAQQRHWTGGTVYTPAGGARRLGFTLPAETAIKSCIQQCAADDKKTPRETRKAYMYNSRKTTRTDTVRGARGYAQTGQYNGKDGKNGRMTEKERDRSIYTQFTEQSRPRIHTHTHTHARL